MLAKWTPAISDEELSRVIRPMNELPCFGPKRIKTTKPENRASSRLFPFNTQQRKLI
jgi:hypothetical protein